MVMKTAAMDGSLVASLDVPMEIYKSQAQQTL